MSSHTYVSVQPAYDVHRVINHKRRGGGGDGERGRGGGGWNNIMSLGNCLIFLRRAQQGIKKNKLLVVYSKVEKKRKVIEAFTIH